MSKKHTFFYASPDLPTFQIYIFALLEGRTFSIAGTHIVISAYRVIYPEGKARYRW